MARKKGVKVGYIRLIVVWPFPEKRIRELASKVKAFVVPEINFGQMVLEVERCAGGPGRRDPACPTPAAACTTPRTSATRSWGQRNEHGRGDSTPTSSARRAPDRALPAHGPDAAHLVPDLRHRHGGQVLRQRPREDEASTWTRSSIVSGIGCTGRVAGYMKLDAFHTTHGRAIPFATGLKLGRPELHGHGLLRRRRPVGDRRQPPHPRRAAQHGHARSSWSTTSSTA